MDIKHREKVIRPYHQVLFHHNDLQNAPIQANELTFNQPILSLPLRFERPTARLNLDGPHSFYLSVSAQTSPKRR